MLILSCFSLAWHDAGTYDAKTKTGGPNGSIRNDVEYKHGANNGLKIAIDLCEEVKAKHPRVTYADLYQLAGVVAVEVTGGPTIDFVPGRKDSNESPNESEFCLMPSKVSPIITDYFDPFHRLSFWLRVYFQCQGLSSTKNQELLKEDDAGLLKLPTDKALVEDPKFRYYVELYAKDEEAFFKDYAESHKKLSELGFNPPTSCFKLSSKNAALLAQSAVGVAVAATVVVLSYFYEVNRKFK
ncbi:L-ascorbate peroxidase 3-like protein [Tanacetum coccineum]